MRNISPSNSKSDAIHLDLGRCFPFRGLFLALLLPSLDLDPSCTWCFNWLKKATVTGTNAGFSSDELSHSYSDPSTSITSSIFLGWLAIITIDAYGKTFWPSIKIKCTFVSWTLSIKGFIERRALKRTKWNGNKTKNGSRIIIIEVGSSWVPAAFFYKSYIGAKSIPQHLRSPSTGYF